MVRVENNVPEKGGVAMGTVSKKAKIFYLNHGPNVTREKETVSKMIGIYCRRKHRQKNLCKECRKLLTYAHKKLSLCPYGEKKRACFNCHLRCYKPEYRDKIRAVMRYSGKWMLILHPVYSIKHLLNKVSE